MVTGKSFSNLDSSSLAYHVDMYYLDYHENRFFSELE